MIHSNNFNQEQINFAIESMKGLLEGIVKELKTNNKDKARVGTLNQPLSFDGIPQDFHFIELEGKQAYIQMLKPKLQPCFYFIKDNVHVFTDSIKQTYEFLTEKELCPVSQAVKASDFLSDTTGSNPVRDTL